jgi:hypothetical protein
MERKACPQAGQSKLAVVVIMKGKVNAVVTNSELVVQR